MNTRIESLARRGRKFRREGLFRKAANAYGELTSIEPDYSPWWVLLGVCQRDLGHDDEARRALRQALFLLRQQDDDAREVSVRALLADLDGHAGYSSLSRHTAQSSAR